MITVNIDYFAALREQAGRSNEMLQTEPQTTRSLYMELQRRYGFSLPCEDVAYAVNECFVDAETLLAHGDHVVFIPPIAGG